METDEKTAAVQRILAAASNGEVEVEYSLGVFYRDGYYVDKNQVQAREMFSRAAHKGHVAAQVELGYACALGVGGPQDTDEAVRWYRAAAESGNAIAQYNLGAKYDQGLGVPRNAELAFSWYLRAAQQDHAPSQFNIANMLDEGLGAPQDHAAATAWCQRAATQGLAQAQYNLARRYEKGRELERDLAQAIYWYELAAQKGLSEAQHKMGVLSFTGEGLPRDYESAFGWFQAAAEQGNADAAKNLQMMVSNGLYQPYDDDSAEKSLRIAMAANDATYQAWPKESVDWARDMLQRARGYVPSVEKIGRGVGPQRTKRLQTEIQEWRKFDNTLKGYGSACHCCGSTNEIQRFGFGMMRVTKSELNISATAATALASALLIPLVGSGAIRLPGRNLQGSILYLKLALCPICRKREANWMGFFMLKERHIALHPLWKQLQEAGFAKFLNEERVPYELRSGQVL